jgi:hypothetical protein
MAEVLGGTLMPREFPASRLRGMTCTSFRTNSANRTVHRSLLGLTTRYVCRKGFPFAVNACPNVCVAPVTLPTIGK